MPSDRTADRRAAVLTGLDAAAARRWAAITRSSLALRRSEIDALNVFPVHDCDTGTNLYLTFDGALDAARDRRDRTGDEEGGRTATPVSLGAATTDIARAMLRTARGSSGVLLSQILRGVADEVAATRADVLDGPGLARALTRADRLARASVGRPVEGTMLSVSQAAARAGVRAAEEDGTLYAVSAAALAAARHALASTPAQLPVLQRAGVVDAGGAGYVVLLEALERVVGGNPGTEALTVSDPLRRRRGWAQPVSGTGRAANGDLEGGGPAYEVMFLLSDSTAEAVAGLRGRLDELGDSLLVVGSDDLWNVHVHVDDVGAALEAALVAGRPHRIRVTHFGEQARSEREPAAGVVLACAAGEGLAVAFGAAGAEVVMSGGRRPVSAGRLLEAVRRCGAGPVLLLPNDADTELAAQAAASAATDEGLDVTVVRTRAAVQGIAALAVFDPQASRPDNVLAMSSAAAATRTGAVTTASEDALTSVGWCHAGDVLGVVDDDIVTIGTDEQQVAGAVIERLLGSGGELLTLVSGADAPTGLAESVAAAARARRRDLEVTTIHGGQPVYSLLVGLE